jgi:hypothetical protein
MQTKIKIKKVKESNPWRGPEGTRRVRLLDFMIAGT